MGFIAGRMLNVQQQSITQMLFYIVNPVVIFHNISIAKIAPNMILIPIGFFIICCSMCLTFYHLGKKIWEDDTKNILALSAGTGNLGYMMLPIVYVFFGQELLVVFFLMVVGMSFYENTLGFYISAAGKYTAWKSLLKVLRLPSLYSFILAFIVNKMGIVMPDSIGVFTKNISVMYSILGMMVVGLSVSNIKKLEIDFKLLGMCLLARFVAWPLMAYIIVLLDRHIMHIYTDQIHQLWMVTSFIPLGVNSLIVATILNNKPEKITSALLITTVTAFLYIPIAIRFFVNF
jgi:hypothetical protein